VVGFAAGIPRLPLNLVLLKRCKVLGVHWRGFLLENPAGNDRNIASLVALWYEQLIQPKVQPLFHLRMRLRRSRRWKIARL
jgi:NADPH2:quinone reductase